MQPSTRFLLAGLSAAATTGNAIRPVVAHRPASVPAFAFGLTPSELPLQTGRVAAGDRRAAGPQRRAARLAGRSSGVAAYAASVAGLASLHRDAQAGRRGARGGAGGRAGVRLPQPHPGAVQRRATRCR